MAFGESRPRLIVICPMGGLGERRELDNLTGNLACQSLASIAGQ